MRKRGRPAAKKGVAVEEEEVVEEEAPEHKKVAADPASTADACARDGGANKHHNDKTPEKEEEENETEAAQDQYMPLQCFGEHRRAVSSVKFAPSRLCKQGRGSGSSSSIGAVVASSSADGSIKLWDLAAAANDAGAFHHRRNNNDNDDAGRGRTAMQPALHLVGHTRGVNEVAWNPVSPFLASASDDKTVRLWDVITGEPIVEYRGHDNFVFCVDQHQHMLVSGSFDETVKLWDIRSGECVSTLPAHSDPVTSVGFNRDGTVVCSASHDGLIRLWDVATGECLKTIYAAGNPPVCSAKFSPNSKYILGGTLGDATLRLWPVHRTGSNQCAKTYRNAQHHQNTKYSIVADFMCDGNIVTGSETGEVLIYDLQSSSVRQVMKWHEDAVLAVSAHDKLPLLATGAMTADRRVEFWAPKGFTLPTN